MSQGKEYYAFISYKREDEKWAKWLQDKLEHYKFPTNLNGRTDLPKNIRPTFRDVTDLKPGLLAEEIHNALLSSEWLIVVCSPRSAKSPWVCKEAQTFIDLGRADHIIPFVIEGIPFSNDPATECYPEALLNLTGSKELLAANINEMGRDAAVIKVVACMFNLRFDVLWQRYEREIRKKKNIIITIVVTAFLCISGVALWTYWQNLQIQKANWKKMENQSRVLIEKANQLVDEGDSYLAQLLLLEALPKDLNHPQRPYLIEAEVALRRASMHCGTILRGHSDKVSSSRLSPDCKQILSASYDRSIRIWDAYTGICIDTLKGHSDKVYFANYNSDGNRIISTSADKTVRLWDTKSKQCVVMNGHSAPVYYALFSPDEKFVASISKDLTIKVWDANTGVCIHTLKGDKYQVVRTINFTNDSRYLVSVCQEDMIMTWDVRTGKCINKCMPKSQQYYTQYFHYEEEESYNDNCEYLSAISPDGKIIAFVRNYSDEAFLGVYDIQTGISFDNITRKIAYWGEGADIGYIRSISFSPNGDLIFVSAKDRICGYNIQTGMCEYDTKRAYDNWNEADTTRYLLTTNPNDRQIDVTERRIKPSRIIKETIPNGLFYKITDPVLSPNGKYLAYYRPAEVDSGMIVIWDVQNKSYRKIRKEGDLFCFSADSKFIAWGNSNGIVIQDTQTGTIIKRILGISAIIKSVCFSSDNKFIVASCGDQQIRICEVETGKCRRILSGHTSDVLSASFSSDNKFILSASQDGSARIWNVCSGECIQTLRDGNKLDRACYSRDNQFVATISKLGKTVNIWKVSSGEKVLTINIPLYLFENNVNVSFSRNDRYIGVGNEIWDLHEKKHVNSFSEGYSDEELIGFCPDLDYLVTYSGMEIHFWYFPPLQELIDETYERFKNRQLTPEERRKYYLE